MISPGMPRPAKIAAAAGALGAAAVLAACGGTQSVHLSHADPNYRGAQLFSQHCSGCHTLDVAGAEGSATRVRDRERTNGPNFNVRKEQRDQILYAIRNGGFSGRSCPRTSWSAMTRSQSPRSWRAIRG